MKKAIIIILSLAVFPLKSFSQSAIDIMKKVDEVSYVKSSKSAVLQTVINPEGEKRIFKIVSYSYNGNEKTLIHYIYPNRVKGMKILTLKGGEEIWAYFPRTNRTRRIASSARKRKVQGSDFTYDDLAQGKYVEQYKGKLLSQEKYKGRDCYKLKLIPTKKGPIESYSKLVVWIDKEKYIPLRIDYYDVDNELQKRLLLEDYKTIQGHITPMKLIMENLQDGGKTIMEIKAIKFDIKLSKDIFSPDNLSK